MFGKVFAGIDVGRSGVKATAGDAQVLFPASIAAPREVRIGNDHNNYTVTLDGRTYFVGDRAKEGVGQRELLTDDKITEDTKVYALTALGLTLAQKALPHGVVLAIGLPIDQFTAENKRRMKTLLKGTHFINIAGVGERVITLTDENVIPVPEGPSAFWGLVLDDNGKVRRNELLEFERALVIDIGRRTVNYVTIEFGRLRDLLSGTLNYGANELEIIMGDTPENRAMFAERVYSDLTMRLPDIRKVQKVILTGGGMLKAGDFLLSPFSNHFAPPDVEVVPDPVFANVIGMRKLGMLHAEQVEAQGH